MKLILVTGTPCTGKTTYAKKLCRVKNYYYFDVNLFIKSHKLHSGFDKKYDSFIVNIEDFVNSIETHIKNMKKSKLFKSKFKGVVVDSHLSHYISPKMVDLCVVMRCDLGKLKKRLEKRGYSKSKVEENVEVRKEAAEIKQIQKSEKK